MIDGIDIPTASITSSLAGLAGAVIGCRHAYLSAVNDAQRRHYRRVFRVAGPLALVFIGVFVGAMTGVLPQWLVWVDLAVWTAGIVPAISWSSRRLRELAMPDPYVAIIDGPAMPMSLPVET
ncbi:MAG: hypothetical protein R3D33_18370 [Hyphomicrobiaceae bacterium]